MDFGYIAIVLVIILLSMTLHEAMHAFMGFFLGDDTAKKEGRLTLNPIKHIDPVMTVALPLVLAVLGGPIFGGAKPVPYNPGRVRYGEWGAALVAVAGPLTNLLIAFMVFGAGVLGGAISVNGIESSLFGTVIVLAVQINLGFFIFNILPIPPLDGSRVLYALAPEAVRRVMEQIERYGIILVFGLVMVASPLIGRLMVAGIQGCLNLFMFIFQV